MEPLPGANITPPGSRLRVDVTPGPTVTVVRPVADWLDMAVAAQFRASLAELVKKGHRNLVIDLSAVSSIDSSGLGALVSALKMLRIGRDRRSKTRQSQSRRPVARGDLRLAALQPPVVSLLEIIRMDRVFPSYGTVAEAVASFE